MIELKNLTKKFDDFTAVDSINLEIGKGEFFGLLGANGAGKTTTISMLSTLLLPTSGEIYIDGQLLSRKRPELKRKLSVVTQEYSMRQDMNMDEIMEYQGRLYFMPRRQIRERTEELLRFCDLIDYRKRSVRKLSGGMKRKLMVCRALLTEPEILLLDEPTAGMDPISRRQMWNLLRRLNEQNLTILLTTHTILWEKWSEFKRDFYKITLAAMVAPLMYLIVFGMGIQTMSHGEPYLNFLIPGVVALTTMNGSFNAIAQNLNVQRLYEKAFDQVMISPTPLWQFIVGQILGGSLRGLYAGCVILVLTAPIRTGLVFNGFSFLVMLLNGAVFSAIGVVVSFLAKNHADVPRFSNYIIMPMAYLCNTFFAIDSMPGNIRRVVGILPLSQASAMIRTISAGGAADIRGIAILILYLVVFTGIAFWFIYKKKNL